MTTREILTLQVGQAGNQVGTQFWDAIRKEQKLDVDGKVTSTPAADFIDEEQLPEDLANLGVMFNPTLARDTYNATWVPRAILVDLEPGTLDDVKAHPIGHMFRPQNMVFGQSGAGNNWAKGHYTDGAELVEEILDRVRREMEQCDCIQGFQLIHSIGGGTGSGLGTLVMNTLRDTYPDRITSSYTIFPSANVSATVVEPYNAVLSTHQLIEDCDESFILDNQALQNIAKNILKLKQPSFADINQLVAQVLCGVSSSLRFPGTLNSDLRKLGVNLVPFPRLHFFMCSHAPISDNLSSAYTKLNIRECVSQAFSKRNFFCDINPDSGRFLASAFFFRGQDLREQEIDQCLNRLREKRGDDFVEWIPNNLLSSLIRVPSQLSPLSATMVGNTCASREIFQRLDRQFATMYRKRAFLHFYKEEGMDEMEFQEASKNVQDLICEYQEKSVATYDSDEEFDDECSL